MTFTNRKCSPFRLRRAPADESTVADLHPRQRHHHAQRQPDSPDCHSADPSLHGRLEIDPDHSPTRVLVRNRLGERAGVLQDPGVGLWVWRAVLETARRDPVLRLAPPQPAQGQRPLDAFDLAHADDRAAAAFDQGDRAADLRAGATELPRLRPCQDLADPRLLDQQALNVLCLADSS